MTKPRQPPHWQLPPGVTRGLWEYTHSNHIADDYDEYFSFNRLFTFDEQIIAKHLPSIEGDEAPLVADLGCGTGRALIPLARRGFRGLAVDLSEDMLRIVREKADEENLPITCVHANMVELDEVEDDSVDHAICLFSTLGMIRGFEHRVAALRHIRRIVVPGGVFVLHVHNYWYNLYDPGGPWWLLKNYFQSFVRRDVERGDKFFNYRGMTNMFLHVFTPGELRKLLRRSGFRIREMVHLDPARVKALRWPWLFGRFRANGWIVVCE